MVWIAITPSAYFLKGNRLVKFGSETFKGVLSDYGLGENIADKIALTANQAIEKISAEMHRLKLVEREYRMLKELIHVVSEADPITRVTTIRITPIAYTAGKEWKEILKMAEIRGEKT